jgi:hypothetical protein
MSEENKRRADRIVAAEDQEFYFALVAFNVINKFDFIISGNKVSGNVVNFNELGLCCKTDGNDFEINTEQNCSLEIDGHLLSYVIRWVKKGPNCYIFGAEFKDFLDN